MQCKSLEQLATEFNKRFTVGRRFKVSTMPALGVGEMVSSAYIADGRVVVDMKFGEGIVFLNTAHLLIAGYATVRFLKNSLNVKWVELERAGNEVAIIDSDNNDLLAKRVDYNGGCLYFTEGGLPSLRIHKMIIHPKAKEVSHG